MSIDLGFFENVDSAMEVETSRKEVYQQTTTVTVT